MNQQIWSKTLQPDIREVPPADERSLSSGEVLWFLRRHLLHLVLLAIAGALAALAYAAVTPSLYTARAQIVIDPNMPALFADKGGDARSPLDTGQIANQIAILKSEKIARMVLDRLSLWHDKEFLGKGGEIAGSQGFGSLILSLVSPRPAPAADGTADAARRTVLDTFGARLDVRRSGLAYALDVFFSSTDPEKAASIANAVVEAFMQEKADARIEAVREGSQWLSDRIDQVRREMNAATHAVQVFRASHDYRIPRPRPDGAGASPASNTGPATAGATTIEELESSAETLRKIYESLLGVLAESAQKQSAPVMDSRVVTAATRPIYRSSPRIRILVPAAAFGAAALGLGLGLAGLLMDGRVRTRQQIRIATGLDCLGRVPRDEATPASLARPQREWWRLSRPGGHPAAAIQDLTHVSPALISGLRWVRNAILATGQPRTLQTVGFAAVDRSAISLKSAAAVHLARLHAGAGSRTLIIDANLGEGAITRALAPNATHGLFDMLTLGPGSLEGAIVRVQRNCDLLPLAGRGAEGGRDLLGSSLMDAALKSLLSGYDLVIVDLPPICAVAESLAVARLLQGIVLVARWGQTPADALSEGARALEASRASILGTVLMDIDPVAMELAS